MNAIEKLYTVLVSQFPNERITTHQAAEAVGLTRGVTSSYLSKLEKQGKLLKTGTRPVFWQIKHPQSAFDDLIGAHGSLSHDLQHVIEAIVYPGNGLPIFIFGPEGSGKSTLAKAIYHETIRRQIIDETAVFSHLDCSDYQNQKDFKEALLTTIKHNIGTGNAKVNYLYISNIQMLSSSSQHILLEFANQQKNPNVRYIYAATTDTPYTEHMLFKGAAVQVKLTAFKDRPFSERMLFTTLFLQKQADHIKREILISPMSLVRLANFNHAGNITAFKNRIQLLCAEAYAKTPDHNKLTIGQVTKSAILITPKQQSLTTRMASLITNALQLGPTTTDLFQKLSNSLGNGEPITEQNFLVMKVLNQIEAVASQHIVDGLAETIRQTITATITDRYGIKFPKDTTFWQKVTLGFIFARICNDNFTGDQVTYKLQAEIRKRYPRSYYLFKQLLAAVKPQSAEKSYDYLPFFLLMPQYVKKIESINFNAILLAHGRNTASSIQQVVNSLCGNYVFEAFDMPIDVSLSDINGYVQDYLTDQSPSAKGNIVLFDMGSLREMFKEIKKVSDQELIVVNNLTTAMALDVGLRVQRNDAFQTIAEASEHYGATTQTQYFEGLSDRKNIIVSCMSGVGLSEELKKLIDSTLSPSLEIIAVDYKQLHTLLTNHDRKFFANTQLILTTTDVSSDIDFGTDIVNVYNVFDKSSSLKLQTVLLKAGESQESIDKLIERLIRFLSIEGIRGRLQILNPDVVIQASQNIVAHYEDFYSVKFGSRLKLNLYMHLSLMIERMLTSSRQSATATAINKAALTKSEQEFFSLSRGIFQPIEQKFNITVKDYEIALLYQLLKDFIDVS